MFSNVFPVNLFSPTKDSRSGAYQNDIAQSNWASALKKTMEEKGNIYHPIPETLTTTAGEKKITKKK